MNCSIEQRKIAKRITEIYSQFGVKIGDLISITAGARVSRYEFELSHDTKVAKVKMLRDDLSLMLSVPKVRIICPVPRKMTVAFEVPHETAKTVSFDEVFKSDAVRNSADKLRIALGENLFGEAVCLELSKAPHLLIGGRAGAGKTALLKTMISSLIFNNDPSEVGLLLIAPTKDEFEIFEKSEHVLSPVICDKTAAVERLKSLVQECEERAKLFAEDAVRNLDSYNEKAENKLPKIVVLMDEFSFLSGGDFEVIVSRISQIGRALGVHLVLSTGELNSKTITGIIKANIPTRIALSTQTAMESRTIMDATDAECLLSKGDLLLCEMMQNIPQRIQAAYVTDEMITSLMK